MHTYFITIVSTPFQHQSFTRKPIPVRRRWICAQLQLAVLLNRTQDVRHTERCRMHTIMQSTAAAQMLQMSTTRPTARQMMQMMGTAASTTGQTDTSGGRAQANGVVLL